MPQDNWKTIFDNQVKLREELIERIKKGKSDLKFNRPYLIVSDIASQFYSEAQLELDYIFGKIETKEQKEGAILHERMAEDAVVIEFKELMETIPTAEETVILKTTFFMKFDGDIIVGKPDIIIFKRGIPIFLFEYKFSKYITTFPNQQVQAQNVNGSESVYFTGMSGTIDQTMWSSLPNGYVSVQFFALDGLGNLGTAMVKVVKYVTLESSPPVESDEPTIPGITVELIALQIIVSIVSLLIPARIRKQT